MAEAEAPAEAPADFTGGEVLFTGMTDWSQAQGRGGGGAKKKTDAAAAAAVERQAKYPNITSPLRLSGLQVTSAAAPRRGWRVHSESPCSLRCAARRTCAYASSPRATRARAASWARWMGAASPGAATTCAPPRPAPQAPAVLQHWCTNTSRCGCPPGSAGSWATAIRRSATCRRWCRAWPARPSCQARRRVAGPRPQLLPAGCARAHAASPPAAGAGGKHHSAVVTDDGHSYTFGSNQHARARPCAPPTGAAAAAPRAADARAPGPRRASAVPAAPRARQRTRVRGPLRRAPARARRAARLRRAAVRAELLLAPVRALVDACAAVSCGAEFTVWLTEEGRLLSAGLPQFGQLGHGTDNEYNAKDCARPAPRRPACRRARTRPRRADPPRARSLRAAQVRGAADADRHRQAGAHQDRQVCLRARRPRRSGRSGAPSARGARRR